MKSLTQSYIEQMCQGTGPWTSEQVTYCHQEVGHPVRDWFAFVVTLASLSAFTIVTIVMVIHTVAPR